MRDNGNLALDVTGNFISVQFISAGELEPNTDIVHVFKNIPFRPTDETGKHDWLPFLSLHG